MTKPKAKKHIMSPAKKATPTSILKTTKNSELPAAKVVDVSIDELVSDKILSIPNEINHDRQTRPFKAFVEKIFDAITTKHSDGISYQKITDAINATPEFVKEFGVIRCAKLYNTYQLIADERGVKARNLKLPLDNSIMSS